MLPRRLIIPKDKPLVVTRTAAQAGSSRPLENKVYGSGSGDGFSARAKAFSDKPNPIKHWRKQVVPNPISGPSSRRRSIPYNYPGSAASSSIVPSNSSPLPSCDTAKKINTTEPTQYPNVVVQNSCKPNLGFYYSTDREPYSGSFYVAGEGYPGTSRCAGCNPMANLIRPTFGMTTKRINPIGMDIPLGTATTNITNATTIPYSFDTKAYLRSKQKSFETNQNGSAKPGIDYFYYDDCCITKALPPASDPSLSSGTRKSLYSSHLNTNVTNGADTVRSACCNITYKPSNAIYATQGSVSASSRTDRLKYNTLSTSSGGTEPWAARRNRRRWVPSTPSRLYLSKAKRHICNPSDYVLMDGRLTRPGSHPRCRGSS